LITRLRLKNWKSHGESELEFSPGSNGLVGIVGSGKTSILDAISFGLFGTFPKLQLRKIKLDNVIMKKPSEKEKAEVEVFFKLGENNYSVKRIIEKKKGTSYSEIKENGIVLESPSTTNVTSIVEKKLKVNYELFSKAIYAEQNSVDYFLSLGKGQRMKKIDELLMIDRFEKARASSVKLTNRISDRKAEKQTSVDNMKIEDLEKSISDIEDSIAKMAEEKNIFVDKIEKITRDKKEIESEIEKYKKIRDELESLKTKEKVLDKSIELTKADIEKIKEHLNKIGDGMDFSMVSSEILNYSKKIDDTVRILSEVENNYEKMMSEFSEFNTKIEFLKRDKLYRMEIDLEKKLEVKSKIEKLREGRKKEIGLELSEKKADLQKIVSEMESCRIKASDLNEQIEKLSSLDGSCPVCDTPLSDKKKKVLLEEKQSELEELRNKIELFEEKKTYANAEIDNLEELVSELEKMKNDISDIPTIESEIEKSKMMLKEYIESSQILKSKLHSMKDDMERSKSIIEEAKEKKHAQESISSQLGDYKSKLENLERMTSKKSEVSSCLEELGKNINEGSLKKMDEEMKRMISDKKEYEMELINLDKVMEEKKLRLDDYNKTLIRIKSERDEIEKMENMIKDLKVLTNALKQTQEELRTEFVEAVNFTMSRLWETLYPYQDFVSVRLSIEEGDYVLQLQERTMNWVDVEGTASGGERSIACLALRISFALVLAPQLRWLVLDEPTHNLDAKSVEDLSQTLREGITDIVDQVFIITHEEKLESAITGSLYRLERDKSQDESTKIIQVN